MLHQWSINMNCHLYMERDGYEEDEKGKGVKKKWALGIMLLSFES